MEEVPVATFRRKVLYLHNHGTGAKITIPRWWVGDCEEVKLEVYADKLVIKKVEARE